MHRLMLLISLFGIFCKTGTVYASLISSEDKNTQRERSVLVSAESVAPDLDFVVRSEPDRGRDVLISREEPRFTSAFIVRPQPRKDSAALVNRPDETDLKILNIINDSGISSVEEYSQWLKENIQYRQDEGADSWAAAEVTLERRYGDCEDFAFLNAAVMRIFGYKPKVLGVVGGLAVPSHAVCVFEKDGEYFWFDNATLKDTYVSSLEEVSGYFFKNYLCARVIEIQIDNPVYSVAAQTLDKTEP